LHKKFPDDASLHPHVLKHVVSYYKYSLPYACLLLLKIVVSDLVDEVFHISPQEKIQCDKYGDLGGQAIAAPLLIHPPGVV
jgi:hypothetical protein